MQYRILRTDVLKQFFKALLIGVLTGGFFLFLMNSMFDFLITEF